MISYSNNVSEEITQQHINVWKVLSTNDYKLFMKYETEEFKEIANEVMEKGYYDELERKENWLIFGIFILIISFVGLLFLVLGLFYED